MGEKKLTVNRSLRNKVKGCIRKSFSHPFTKGVKILDEHLSKQKHNARKHKF